MILIDSFEKQKTDEYAKNSANITDLNLSYQNKSGIITDTCNIHLEKDLKICKLLLSKINNKKFIEIVKNYIFDNLGMEEIIVSTDDKNLSKELFNSGFESLGQDDDLQHFVIDKMS